MIPPELAKLCELENAVAEDPDTPRTHFYEGDAKIAIQYLVQLHARMLCTKLAHATAEHELEKKQRRHNQWATKVSKRANELYSVLHRGEELCTVASGEGD